MSLRLWIFTQSYFWSETVWAERYKNQMLFKFNSLFYDFTSGNIACLANVQFSVFIHYISKCSAKKIGLEFELLSHKRFRVPQICEWLLNFVLSRSSACHHLLTASSGPLLENLSLRFRNVLKFKNVSLVVLKGLYFYWRPVCLYILQEP